MKKIIFVILFLSFHSLCFAGAVSVDSFLTADDVSVAHLEDMRSTFQGAINSADGTLLQTGTITSSKLDANTNPENRWNEAFNDFIYSGLTVPTSASLASTTASGVGYIQGVRVVKDATAHTYTASKHTFVDLSKTGTFTYSEVAIGAAEPVVASNSIRLGRVSTDSTTVNAFRDDRVTTITLGTGSVTSLSDADADTQIQTEESADEDKIRFDTAGTERAIIDSTGLTLNNQINMTVTTGTAPFIIASTTVTPNLNADKVDGVDAKLFQVVRVISPDVVTCSGTIAIDNSIPQNNEGSQLFTASITPTSASNNLEFEVVVNMGAAGGAGTGLTAALFQDTTANALACAGTTEVNNAGINNIKFFHNMTAGTTSSTTFKVRAGATSGNSYLNGKGTDGSRVYGGISASGMIIREVAP